MAIHLWPSQKSVASTHNSRQVKIMRQKKNTLLEARNSETIISTLRDEKNICAQPLLERIHIFARDKSEREGPLVSRGAKV